MLTSRETAVSLFGEAPWMRETRSYLAELIDVMRKLSSYRIASAIPFGVQSWPAGATQEAM